MKIQITFNLDSEDRRAINSFVGDKGLATYKECKAEINEAVLMHLGDLHEGATKARKAEE
tara:strand:+ start:1357 stop:1536 length:180 start_codon:yes stop_codon:yes gene_type:complete